MLLYSSNKRDDKKVGESASISLSSLILLKIQRDFILSQHFPSEFNIRRRKTCYSIDFENVRDNYI